MKKTVLCALSMCAMMMLQSCYVQNVSVGMNASDPKKEVAKVKNHQFLFALIQPKEDRVENYVKNTKQYTIQTQQTFWDGLLSGITMGIYTPSTTYYFEGTK